MDDSSRRRRQNEAPYSGSDPRFDTDNHGRVFQTTSSDRYRPTPLSTTSPTTGRGNGDAAAYPTYYQEPSSSFPSALPQNTLSYQNAAYTPDQRQQQNFPTYNTDIMYNVTQQTTTNTVYDATAQFQARQPAAMQMLSDVAAPYFAGDNNTATNPPSLQHHPSSGSSSVYPQHQPSPGDRASLLQSNYSGTLPMNDIPQSTEMMDEEEYQPQGPGMEAAYTAYQTALKEIFQNILSGRLAEASQSLLEVSEWLLGHVGDLGLTVDEVNLHADRIRLWGEFNTAWLSIFQKQKDLLESRQSVRQPQSLMSQDFITKMAKDLIRMCDAVEKHGLVDYQYGVAEEQIMTSVYPRLKTEKAANRLKVLTECLELQESIEGVTGGGISHSSSRGPP